MNPFYPDDSLFRRMWVQSAPAGRRTLMADAEAYGMVAEDTPDFSSAVPPRLRPLPWALSPPADRQAQTDAEGNVVGNPGYFASENPEPTWLDQAGDAVTEMVVTASRIVDGVARPVQRTFRWGVLLAAFAVLAVVVVSRGRAADGR